LLILSCNCAAAGAFAKYKDAFLTLGRDFFQECGGSGICQHNRLRAQCKVVDFQL
jgi:hypothetical protein